MLAMLVPRTSAQTYARLARVLSFAAGAHHPAQDRAVIEAVLAVDVAKESMFVAVEIAPVDARRLHEEARQAYWTRRHVPEAMDLALRAFGANPYDPEIAGTLAFLSLRVVPSRPERARQLALHAIGLRSTQHSGGRADDWTNFAIASALTGRLADARHGLYASHCAGAQSRSQLPGRDRALATFGEPVREPVEALLDRLGAQGRADDSPYCARPQARTCFQAPKPSTGVQRAQDLRRRRRQAEELEIGRDLLEQHVGADLEAAAARLRRLEERASCPASSRPRRRKCRVTGAKRRSAADHRRSFPSASR